MNNALVPTRPILAVLGRDVSKVQALIARQARAPLLGHFSLPGGDVEAGETLSAAPARELREEVSVEAEIIAFDRHVEAIVHDGRLIQPHYGASSVAEDQGRAALER